MMFDRAKVWAALVLAMSGGCSTSSAIIREPLHPRPAPALAPAANDSPALAPRVRALARFVRADVEERLFGEQLISAGLVPIELSMVVVEGDDAISLLSAETSATFSDGNAILVLSADKTQALLQTFPAAVVALPDVVFFQSPSMPRATPESVAIALREDRTGRVEKVTLRIEEAEPSPDD